ncbi:MAG TPA: thioesterase [Chitinophagaceae bacterium]|nr:thioesterase [Chitinophagaceae bacterium]
MHLPKSHFTISITVAEEHLDELRHVNNVIYVKWMEDIARQHWKQYASQQLQDELFWMIKKHEIVYFNQAFLNDHLMMHTWTGAHTNITWIRHYEITRPADNKKIIEAHSVWIPLDKKTQRPVKITGELISMFE